MRAGQPLCATVPDDVSDDEAAFTVLGAIALQGIRLAQPTLGEAVVVTGLGLIGLLTVQLLRAHGCRVLGIDFDPAKLELAQQLRRRDGRPRRRAKIRSPRRMAFSRGRGVDAVIITASTKSNEPVHQAALMCRKRGRIVLVGVTGLELSRADFYEKELTFQVSCSYGPGRYDPNYEEKGHDYPVGFVRWTEQRNFEAVLDMMADGRLDVKPLISHRFAIDDAAEAYELVGWRATPSLGILLDYPRRRDRRACADGVRAGRRRDRARVRRTGRVGFIGAGNYATARADPGVQGGGRAACRPWPRAAASAACMPARKFGFAQTTTDTDERLRRCRRSTRWSSPRGTTATRDFVLPGARARASMCSSRSRLRSRCDELDADRGGARGSSAPASAPIVMVGFNRRFAPHVRKMKALLARRARAQGVRHDGERRRDSRRALDAGSATSAAAASSARPVTSSTCCASSPARPIVGACSRWRWHAARRGDTATITLVVRRRIDRHDPLLRERQQGVPEGAARGVRGRARPAARQLPPADAASAGPASASMKLWRQDKGQKACAAAFVQAVEQGGAAADPARRAARGEPGHDRGWPSAARA